MADEPRSIYNNMKIAELYKAAQQTTEPFATLMIRKAGLDHFDQTPLVVLDNACGTGVISAQLYEMLDESVKDEMQLVCGDNSERMVEYVKQKIQDDGWKGAKAEIVDAQVRATVLCRRLTVRARNYGF